MAAAWVAGAGIKTNVAVLARQTSWALASVRVRGVVASGIVLARRAGRGAEVDVVGAWSSAGLANARVRGSNHRGARITGLAWQWAAAVVESDGDDGRDGMNTIGSGKHKLLGQVGKWSSSLGRLGNGDDAVAKLVNDEDA